MCFRPISKDFTRGAILLSISLLYWNTCAKKIATPEHPAPLPKVAEEQAKSFNNLLEYLGLSDEIVPAEIVM
jgi:hypothetical protein